MTAAAQKLMQHLVTDDHFVVDPIASDVDLMSLLPVTGALAARAGKTGARNDEPLDAIEVPAQSGASFRLGPPFPVDRRRGHGALARRIEATAGQCEAQEREATERAAEHGPAHAATGVPTGARKRNSLSDKD